MHKIIKISLAFACFALIVPMGSMNAKEENITSRMKKEEAQLRGDQYVDESFTRFDSSRKILQLPDGGFVQGSLIECKEDGAGQVTTIAVYDSETDPKAVSVETAKKMMKKLARSGEVSLPVATPRGSEIPTKTFIVLANTHYESAIFTYPGWRVSDRKYKPEEGTGNYLRWSSYIDTGRAGTESMCLHTIMGGPLEGTFLPVGVPTYVYSSDWTMYYTYNPIHGTQYVVENR